VVFQHPGKGRGGLVEAATFGQKVAVLQSGQYSAGVDRHGRLVVLPDRLRFRLDGLLEQLLCPGRLAVAQQ
jgi:hypothetical protein